MRFIVSFENTKFLSDALKSSCDAVRFGTEFCEWNIPTTNALKEAHQLTLDSGKEFIYITPRLPIDKVDLIKEHFQYLNETSEKNKTVVVINDLGGLNILSQGTFSNLYPYLGRQLISIPSRARPPMAELMKGGVLKRFISQRLFNRTNLNYGPTINFFKELGVKGVDIDWLPDTFPYIKSVARNKLNVCVHSHLSIIAITRSCHTARFLGEKEPEHCSMPCLNKTFLLKHEAFGDMYLSGNTIFGMMDPKQEDFESLRKNRVTDLVVAMNPLTKTTNADEINNLISNHRR